MNIILLSGGSGKRLWPLSNDVRSKQFLRLFEGPDGAPESMIQRVTRQILRVDPDARVTVATSESQVSSIRNQVGKDLSVCVEPARRDTFPAIALASLYLRDVSLIRPEEPVVVCPVDPYVEDSYFEALKKLHDLVLQDTARLTLMGIAPTVPSKKYGYILPETSEPVSPVTAFFEKPDRDTAASYIRRGALWNAGIFAFRLGYLLEIAERELSCTTYADLLSRYTDLPRISFDYAVVEKEPSIQVMRYTGEWKDVGSWNMMAEVMPRPAMGEVLIDETCSNVHVVNEMDIPILVMGAHDLVVAASGDGILVSDKERSGAMKPYVERICREARFAEKSWGTYTVLGVMPRCMTIRIHMAAGSRMTTHVHAHRDEVYTFTRGTGQMILNGEPRPISPGDVVQVPAGTRHTLIADTDLDAIEVQVGDEIAAGDKTVLEPEPPTQKGGQHS